MEEKIATFMEDRTQRLPEKARLLVKALVDEGYLQDGTYYLQVASLNGGARIQDPKPGIDTAAMSWRDAGVGGRLLVLCNMDGVVAPECLFDVEIKEAPKY